MTISNEILFIYMILPTTLITALIVFLYIYHRYLKEDNYDNRT